MLDPDVWSISNHAALPTHCKFRQSTLPMHGRKDSFKVYGIDAEKLLPEGEIEPPRVYGPPDFET